jgi:UDP-GlcNAc3NAcA epimerase
LAGALAAVKLHIPVAHVEAGLRSFNRRMPEEVNRVLTDHASDLLFAPTDTAVRNLSKEGITGAKVQMVGDVMYDAALFYRDLACKPAWFDGLGVEVGEFVLCTIHRAENTDDNAKLRGIFQGLAMSEQPVVLPLHPRTRTRIALAGIEPAPNIRTVAPVGYLEMTWLEMNCRIVATDSGGVQKEAYFHRKPCVTLREETEWVELVESGVNRLVPSCATDVRDAVLSAMSAKGGFVAGLYGNGDAAGLIVRSIADSLTNSRSSQLRAH